MERPTLTPAQQRVLQGLLQPAGGWPTFDPDLPVHLREAIEHELAPVAATLEHDPLHVSKTGLAQVLQCERHHLAESESAFAWSVSTARGTVAHKAIELGAFMTPDTPPLTLVDAAVDRIVTDGDEWTPRTFLLGCSEAELAELKAEVNDVVAKFAECFPPIAKRWRPRFESSVRVELCDDRIFLRAKADIVLGRPAANEARVLLIDLKTGRPHVSHVEHLRFYALVETIRMGTPPWRVASYYLESATWHHEDITEDILASAARRVVDGVTRLATLRSATREPTISPGPACSYCSLRTTCEGAEQWVALSAAMALGDDA